MKGCVFMNKNELINKIYGESKTLIIGIQFARGENIYVYSIDKSQMSNLPSDYFDTACKSCRWFIDCDDGFKLTYHARKGGAQGLSNIGLLIKVTNEQELEKYRFDGEKELGHALERLCGEQLTKDMDMRGFDIAITARFTATRVSTRRAQVKLVRYGCKANWKDN